MARKKPKLKTTEMHFTVPVGIRGKIAQAVNDLAAQYIEEQNPQPIHRTKLFTDEDFKKLKKASQLRDRLLTKIEKEQDRIQDLLDGVLTKADRQWAEKREEQLQEMIEFF